MLLVFATVTTTTTTAGAAAAAAAAAVAPLNNLTFRYFLHDCFHL